LGQTSVLAAVAVIRWAVEITAEVEITAAGLVAGQLQQTA